MLADTCCGRAAAAFTAAVGAVADRAGVIMSGVVHDEPVPSDHLRNHLIESDYGAHVCTWWRCRGMLAGGTTISGHAESGSGVGCTVHLLPFQASARVWFWVVPTVTQAVAVMHDTPAGTTSGSSPGAPGGTGSRS